ncbi:MAG: DMT family transporter [Candidatus Binataceae bacterium]
MASRATPTRSSPIAGPRDAHHARELRIGLLLAACNTILGAGFPVLMRVGAVTLNPLLYATCSATVAACCSIPLLCWRGELRLIFRRRFLPWLIAMGLSGTVVTSLALAYGLSEITAVAGVILMQTEPIYSLVLATVVIGERPSPRQLIATATILLGIASVFGTHGLFSPAWAAALILMTPLFWQISHILGLRMMPPLAPITITGARFIVAASALLLLYAIVRPAPLTQLAAPRAIALVLASGVFIYFLSALTWYGAISRLSLAWATAVVVPGMPLLSVAFAAMFLAEQVTRREVFGILIAISGILALVLGSEGRRMLPPTESIEAVHQPLA